jgi:hypothetical protein
MPYRVKLNWDQDEEDLELLAPQPASPDGVQQARRANSAAGLTYPDGERFIELSYSMLLPDEKADLDEQLGVSDTVFSSLVTIDIRENSDDFGIYNAIVDYPEVGRKARRTILGWSDVVYVVHLVEALD